MSAYSEHEQRKLDQESGAELDRRAAKRKHMSGPLRIRHIPDSSPDAPDEWEISEPSGNLVCVVQSEEAARLIAAVPDLLELARAFHEYLADDSRSSRRRAACLAACRVALAKAGVS